MPKRDDSAARWREIVREQAASGLSVAAYCRRARVPQSSFSTWRRKLRDAGTFAEVRVTPEPDSVDDPRCGHGGEDGRAAPTAADSSFARISLADVVLALGVRRSVRW